MTRRLSRLAALIVLPALWAVLLTAPAYAIDPGDTNGGNDGGGIGSKGIVYCVGGAAYQNGQLVFRYPHPRCLDSSFQQMSTNNLCQTAVEVWRFYGTNSNPVQAMTVSTMGLPKYCGTYQFTLFSPHPFDRGPGSDSAGYVGGTTTNYQGNRVAYVPGSSSVLSPSAPSRFLGGRCSDLNRYRADFVAAVNDNWDPAYNDYIYQNWYAPYVGRYGQTVALRMANLASVGPNRADDGVLCTSGLEFATPAEVPASQQAVYGVCYIPIVARAAEYRRGTETREFSIYHRGGHRYDNITYGFRSSTPGYTPPANVSDAWRTAIYNEAVTRSGRPTEIERPGDPYPNPSDPSAGMWVNKYDQVAAALTAANYSRCALGASTSTPMLPVEQVTYTFRVDGRGAMSVPEWFQTGGRLHLASPAATVSDLRVSCTATRPSGPAADETCPSARVQMVGLGASWSVIGLPNGSRSYTDFREYGASNTLTHGGATVVLPGNGTWRPLGPASGSSSITLGFFSASRADWGQAVQVSANLVGTALISYRDPVTGAMNMVSVPISFVQPGPVARPVIGATPIPGN